VARALILDAEALNALARARERGVLRTSNHAAVFAAVLVCLLPIACGGRVKGSGSPRGTVDAAAEAAELQDASCAVVLASDFDQSCDSDEDCLVVTQGNSCATDCGNICPSAAINAAAEASYTLALDSLSLTGAAGCTCYPLFGPCCRAGACMIGRLCSPFVDAGEDSAEVQETGSQAPPRQP
jgi:hypothetical protein